MSSLKLAGFFLAAFALAAGTSMQVRSEKKERDELDGYRSWTKVNLLPMKMLAFHRTALCVGLITRESLSPHTTKFITVYVNDAGKKAMLEQLQPKFPVGSVIVKDKFQDDKKTLELSTVMIKRPKGFDPKMGDWEFYSLSKDGKVETSEKVAECKSCHLGREKQDYVFRTYLPSDKRQKLK